MKNLGKKVIAVTLLGVVVYAAFAFLSDVGRLRQYLSHFTWWTFAAALALAFGNYVLRFFKWEYYLRRLDVGANRPGEPYAPLPTLESFVIFLSGFVMSVTPGKAGEVFKSALLASARGVRIARSAPIIVAERLTDLLALIVLVAVGSGLYPQYTWIAVIASGMVAGVLLLVFSRGLARWVISLVERLPIGARIAPKLRVAYESLRIVSSPVALLLATLLSAAAWGLECTALWLILRGLGTPVSVPIAFFTYGTATIAGAIAMLPGGLGGTEVTMQQMLRALGHVGTAAAAAATLLVRLATLWFAVIVGFVALAIFRARYDRSVTLEAESADRPHPATTPTPHAE